MKRFLPIFLLAFMACALPRPAGAQPWTPEVDPEIRSMLYSDTGGDHDIAKFAQFRARLALPERNDPARVVAIYQQFFDHRVNLEPAAGVVITSVIADIDARRLKQTDKALKIYATARGKYRDQPSVALLVTDEAALLASLDRQTDGETLLTEWLPQLIAAGPAYTLARLGGQPDSVAAWYTGQVVGYLLANGRAGEGLGWAKLWCRLCPYRAEAVTQAAALLARAWTAPGAKTATGAPTADRTAWMHYQLGLADGADSLASVKLPVFDPATVTEQLAAVQGVPGEAVFRESLDLLNGQPGAAMTEACNLMALPGGVGEAEVCRVFKAADGNLFRANAYIDFLTGKAAANPLQAFFADHADAGPAPAGALAHRVAAAPAPVSGGCLTGPLVAQELADGSQTPAQAWDDGALTWDGLLYVLGMEGSLDQQAPLRHALVRLLLSHRDGHSLAATALNPTAKARLMDFFVTANGDEPAAAGSAANLPAAVGDLTIQLPDDMAQANRKDGMAALKAVFAQIGNSASPDPGKGAPSLDAFMNDHPGLQPADISTVALQSIDICSQADNLAAALEIANLSLRQTGPAPPPQLLAKQTELLNKLGRAPEAEKAIEESWPAIAADPLGSRDLLLQYVTALEDQDERGKAADKLQFLMLRNPELLDDARDDSRTALMYNHLIFDLLDGDKYDEALGWAKLRYMECRLDEHILSKAGELLMHVWTAKTESADTAQAFSIAQNDETAANPLQAVQLPALDAGAKAAVLARANDSAVAPHVRINACILLGMNDQALALADKMPVEGKNATERLEEAGRAIKAADLNLVRAYSFEDSSRNGAGVNPVGEFVNQDRVADAAK